jgi:putative ABC transport system permease protein
MAGAIVVAIVVAALVVQNSLSASAEGQIHDLSHNLGKNMLVVPEETDMFDFYTQRYDDATMPDDYPDRIRSSTLARHIRGIQPLLFGNLEVNGVPLVIVGQKALFRASGSDRETVRRAVLGDEAASRLGLKQGDTLVVGDVPLVVAQVAGSMREGFDIAVVTELSVAQQLLDRPGAINAMRVGGCWCSTDVPALAKDVQNLLPGTRAITVAGVLKSQKGIISRVSEYSRILYGLALFLIAGFIAALISNQLRRQKREMGLLLAMGTRPSWVTALFVTTAALVGTTGAILGIFLSFPLAEYFASRMIGYAVPISLELVTPILFAAVGMSMLSALIPAIRAGRLDPTIVLREL